MDVRLYETLDVLKTACQLTEKLYSQDKRILLMVKNVLMMTTLDQMLWSFKQLSFLPHMTDTDNIDPETQPIFLTCRVDQNPNRADAVIACDVIPELINGSLLIGIFEPTDSLIQQFTKTYPPAQRFVQNTDGGWMTRPKGEKQKS